MGELEKNNEQSNDDFNPNFIELETNITGVEKISCNSGVRVPIMLLALKKKGNICNICRNNMAHLYLTATVKNPRVNHYIVAFIDAAKIGDYKELINILNNTIIHLNISNKERPFFYVYFYGNELVSGLTIEHARRYIRLEFENKFCYLPNEEFCQTSPRMPVLKYAKIFSISGENPYRFSF